MKTINNHYILYIFRFILFRVNPFYLHLFYFLSLAFLGSLALSLLTPRVPSFNLRFIDSLYISASALTVSGLGTVEMEVLSNTQLVVIALLMLAGGEVFVSMLAFPFTTIRYKYNKWNHNKVEVELQSIESGSPVIITASDDSEIDELKYSSMKSLSYVVFSYHVIANFIGSISILVYIVLVKSSREVLKRKGLRVSTFCVFVAISSFANGGFIPTNENMAIFKSNSGLLLIVILLVLMGNTLFPLFLRFSIWVLKGLTKRAEFEYMLGRPEQVGFRHLLPKRENGPVAVFVLGLIALQVVLLCGLEWRSDALSGLNGYRKIVVALFEGVNSRHAGESAVDFSVVSAAALVLYIAAMFLPAYTCFLPSGGEKKGGMDKQRNRKGRRRAIEILYLSHLSYIVIFVIIVCIIERKKMRDDPVNFSLLNVIFEVTSAYGNVGFSVSYSCARRLNTGSACVDKAYGFSGWWSDLGKLMIVFVMLFGRVKRFTMNGGKAWRLA
ncbi:Cation transporter HKT1 [Acorus calamus]|uniref:Cation transporter HKT1 n=1 Tax=Acorus calamus TaxID=4465 RepID=A0AAV9EUN9_ACOCL|nr:Cation transporter HKT1 [Acorus calamus]